MAVEISEERVQASPRWVVRSAPSIDSAQAALRPVEDWEEAQAWCNFVLFKPSELPAGTRLENAVLRPEAPPGRVEDDGLGRSLWTVMNRAAHRCEVAGRGRRLRIKQFLYDWAPPAFDHPSLWKSEVRGFPVREHIGWLGSDYLSRPGAAVSLDRTTIELSVMEGTFTDEELQALCRGLSPVSTGARALISSTPFGELCYQWRHPSKVISVPMGYWAYKRKQRDMPLSILLGEAVPDGLPGREVRPPGASDFHLDTTFVYGGVESPHDVEYVYQHSRDPGLSLRVLASWAQRPDGIPYPPQLDEQPCHSRILTIHGTQVHHAWREERYGPHEALWQRGGSNVMLLTKPAVWTDMEWFGALLGELLHQERCT